MDSRDDSALPTTPFPWTGSSSDSENSESERGPGLASIVDVHDDSESCDDGGLEEGSGRFRFRSEQASTVAVAFADSAMLLFLTIYGRLRRGGVVVAWWKGRRQKCIGAVDEVGLANGNPGEKGRQHPTFENEVDQISVRTYGAGTCSGLFGGGGSGGGMGGCMWMKEQMQPARRRESKYGRMSTK